MDEQEEGGSRITSGMTEEEALTPALSRTRERGKTRKAPRWTIAFLKALERTGEVRAAAAEAGVDHTTAYLRRRAHGDFAESWDAAVAAFRAGLQDGEAEAHPSPSHRFAAGPSLSLKGRGADDAELCAAGSQVRRVGAGRWNAAAEKRFFDALAATANVKQAAAAAGVSANAVYARRLKRPDFRAKWAAVLETGRAAIEMSLVEAAKKSFDPDALDTGAVEPTVSVAEAIRIVQLHGSKAQKREIDPFEPPAQEVDAIRARILAKLDRLRQREMPAMLAEGWSFDAEHKQMVPPEWARAAAMTVADGGPRGMAGRHCPHCGGGLKLVTVEEEGPSGQPDN